jgi:hypothetical protein
MIHDCLVVARGAWRVARGSRWALVEALVCHRPESDMTPALRGSLGDDHIP